jgi:predicted transcriptional regulator
MKTFAAEDLAIRLARAGLTQQAIATRLGVSQVAVCRLLRTRPDGVPTKAMLARKVRTRPRRNVLDGTNAERSSAAV